MEGSGSECYSSDTVVWVGSAVPPQPYSWSYRGHVCLPHRVCVHLGIKGVRPVRVWDLTVLSPLCAV